MPDSSPTPARRLNILYHHRTRSRDGQSVHIDEMIHALRAQGHSVEVVEPQRVVSIGPSLNKRVLPKFAYEILEFGYSFLEFLKLFSAAIRKRPDALYERGNIYMLSGVWLARLFRIPLLLEVNAPLAAERGKFDGLSFPGLASWTERVTWRAADRVLPVTGVLARTIEEAGVPRNRIAVTPNGVDLEQLKPIPSAEAKTHLGLSNKLTLGFVGYVRDWHGLDQIVDLMASEPELKETQFLVIGDGPACDALRKQAQTLGVADRLTITGILARDRLPACISAIDIALQPEVTPYASPLKLFEYMALGRAIVAPDTENIREILSQEMDGLLFPPGNKSALAASILRLVREESLRARLGAAAAAKIRQRNLTWSGNAERAISHVLELLDQKRARAALKAQS